MKICLIGNGLGSLFLANKLYKKNLKITVFYEREIYKSNNSQTIGITEKNINNLKKILPNVFKLGNKINQIKIYDNQYDEKISFKPNKEYHFMVIEYNKILRDLQKKLINKKNINFKKTKLSKISLNKKFLNDYDIVIDTNLENSFSKKYFSKKIYKNYLSKAYVTNLSHSKLKNNNIANQIYTEYGPLAFLPISKNKTSIVFSISNKYEFLKKKEIKNLILKYNRIYKIKKFSKIINFNLTLSLLRKYYKENVLAFGDKIHKIHPHAGQGFNMVMRDIEILSNLIENKIQLGLPLDKEILREFQDSTKYKNTIFANGVDLFYEIFELEKKIPRGISNIIFNTLKRNKYITSISSKLANEGF